MRQESIHAFLTVGPAAVDIYRLADGMIVEEWAADDLAAILYQVGAYTPPWLSGSQAGTSPGGAE